MPIFLSPSPSFLLGSQFSCISPNFLSIFHTLSLFSYHTAWSLLYCYTLSSSVSERRTEKWRRERNTQARFRCPRTINSCFLQNVLKERGIHFVTPVIDFLSHWRQSPSRGWQALGSGVYRLSKGRGEKWMTAWKLMVVDVERLCQRFTFKCMPEGHKYKVYTITQALTQCCCSIVLLFS